MSALENKTRTAFQFDPPKTLMEARARFREVNEKRMSVESQLSNLNKRDEDGNRLSAEEWNAWRTRAKTVLRYVTTEQKALKDWIREYESAHVDNETIKASFTALRILQNVFKHALVVVEDPSEDNIAHLRILLGTQTGTSVPSDSGDQQNVGSKPEGGQN